MLTYYALQKLGAMPVSLNVMLRQREIAYIANDAQASAVIGHAGLWHNVPAVQDMPIVQLRVAVMAKSRVRCRSNACCKDQRSCRRSRWIPTPRQLQSESGVGLEHSL